MIITLILITLFVIFFKSSIRSRKKFIKAGAIIACIPLFIIAVLLVLGGVDTAIVGLTIIVPFIIPAILSGAGVGYLIGGIAQKGRKKVEPYVAPDYSSTSDDYDYYNDPNIIDSTCKYVEEDPYGRVKDIFWRASNPQPKDLPIMR